MMRKNVTKSSYYVRFFCDRKQNYRHLIKTFSPIQLSFTSVTLHTPYALQFVTQKKHQLLNHVWKL